MLYHFVKYLLPLSILVIFLLKSVSVIPGQWKVDNEENCSVNLL